MGDDSNATGYSTNPALCPHEGARTVTEAGGLSITECALCGVVLYSTAAGPHGDPLTVPALGSELVHGFSRPKRIKKG